MIFLLKELASCIKCFLGLAFSKMKCDFIKVFKKSQDLRVKFNYFFPFYKDKNKYIARIKKTNFYL